MTPRTQDVQVESKEAYGQVRKYSDRDLCTDCPAPHACRWQNETLSCKQIRHMEKYI